MDSSYLTTLQLFHLIHQVRYPHGQIIRIAKERATSFVDSNLSYVDGLKQLEQALLYYLH